MEQTPEGTPDNDARPRLGRETTCCIAGCGPAGAILGLLLARAGVDVLVLEKHNDFFRDFRGDTIHPSTLEIIDELGLSERFERIPQRRVYEVKAVTDSGILTVADFRHLKVSRPYMSFVPQWDFLDFITDEARAYPAFELRMEAEARDLIRDNGCVVGLVYRSADGMHEVRAPLTVAADGRSSVLRSAAGLTPISFGAPMDVLWFKLSRADSDPDETFGRLSSGHVLVLINRTTYWQVAYVIPKGFEAGLRTQGLDALRSSVSELVPFLADRVAEIATWDDVKGLVVQVNRLKRWHLPGLLFIGDAAHAMSPVGGVGINLAIQDAVAAANLLAEPLRRGELTEGHLARVQSRRWLPTVATQALQRVIQRRFVERVLRGESTARSEAVLRRLLSVGALRRIPARVVGIGVRPEHVETPVYS